MQTHLYLCLKHMFTLDYKETTVNPLSDKVVSGACVCLKIFVHVLKCAIVMKSAS